MVKFRLTPVFAAICLMSGFSSQVFAETAAADDAKTEQLIKKINARTAQLEAEVKQLRSQLVKIKKDEKAQAAKQTAETQKLAKQVSATNKSKGYLLEMGATPVMTSPYIGVRSQYDASDLVVNLPTYNQDLVLLQHGQKAENELARKGVRLPSTPLIELSGKIEGQVIGVRNADTTRSSKVDLSGSELDVNAKFGSWLTGFLALSYDNNAPNTGNVVGGTVTATDNSRIFLNKAWLTIGNLNKSSFYLTVGQRYHFGQYSSFMVSLPVTLLMGRVKARSLLVGYQHPGNNGVYGTVYTFKGDSTAGTSHINQIGATLGYQFKNDTFNTDIGADYINNIADSQGMQNTGAMLPGASPATGLGFGSSATFERLIHRVPGAAVHGKLGMGPVNLVAEYVGATKRFNAANLSMNGAGARPQAFNVEGAYMFKLLNKPANFALGYAQTKDAVALVLPQRRYTATFNVSPWRDTIASLEFRRDIGYNSTDVGRLQTVTITPAGGFTNTVTAQFGVYF